MRKLMQIRPTAFLLLASFALANCVPTSVLANAKDSKLNNFKVKRSSNTNTQSTSSLSSSAESLSNHKPDIVSSQVNGKSEISLGTRQNAGLMETKSAPRKRGVNSQLMYGDIFNTAPSAPIRNGIWSDELDPSVLYPDVQDFEDYQRGTYHVKPYDNLQNILNSELYPEPVALPLHYPYRYYGDRRKRSNVKSLDMRLKRDSKLTPADMLALVALVEAGERSRMEAEDNDNLVDYNSHPYLTSQFEDENQDFGNVYSDPSNYFSLPYSLDSVPLYDIVKSPKPGQRYGGPKRYIVPKKKRSLGPYANDVSDRTNIKFNGRYPSLSRFAGGKGPKRFHNNF